MDPYKPEKWVFIHHIQTLIMFILQSYFFLWMFFLLNLSRLIYFSMTSQVCFFFCWNIKNSLIICFNCLRAKLRSFSSGSPSSCLTSLKSLLSKLEPNTSALQDDVLQMSKVARTGLHPDWSTKRKYWPQHGFQSYTIFQICRACQEKVT